jgi:DNA (cytosine-5)-methyltransferase 1
MKKRNNETFRFIDLFAGIGGFRLAFEEYRTECVFTSEIDKFCRETYEENFGDEPEGDIKEIDENNIPDHEILLGGFPCQSFSLAGVSKKNSLGREHGFDDEETGNLFFDIARVLKAKQPVSFLLENVKHLKNHDSGQTFDVIQNILDDVGYKFFYKVIDARHYVPQHRERIFIAGFRKNQFPQLNLENELYNNDGFSFPDPPEEEQDVRNILEENVDDKYTLSDKLWNYLQDYKEKHRKKGNGFGFGMIEPGEDKITRTLSARYHKDGSEILIKQEGNKNPRRLTPRECARLMGFPEDFKIPVSDTQAYQQFGNSVVVPVVEAIAGNMMDVLEDGQELPKRVQESREEYAAKT